MSRSSFLIFAAALAATLVSSPRASSAQSGLYFEEIAPKAIRVDGSLREWPRGSFQSLGRGRDGAIRYALGYDERGLYIAAEVSDGDVIRHARPSDSDDGIRLTLESAAGRRLHLFVFPAVPGKAAAGAYLGTETKPRTPVRGAEVVEALTSGGYVIEAHVPFGGLRGLDDFPRARGAIALVDADPGRETSRLASSRGALPSIAGSGGELGAFTEFLRREGLEGEAPRFDVRADVLGGRKKERVALVGATLFVGGGDHADGAGFETLRLGAVRASHEATLVDLTGDGKEDVFLRVSMDADGGEVDEAWVVSFRSGTPETLLRVPYALRAREGRIENAVGLENRSRRGPKRVVIRAGTSEGFDPSSLAQDSADDSILLPWGPIASRSYDLEGGRRTVDEEPNRRYEPPAARRTAATGATRSEAPPTVDRLIEAARRQLGLPARAPRRFEHDSNVAGDSAEERIVVIDRTVIVVGPRFRGGDSYFQMQLGVDAPDRIRRVNTLDVDGDGREEALFHVNQDLGQGATRCLLLVYRISEDGAEQIHVREISRHYQGATLRNTYRVVGKGKRRSIVFSPGEAEGFSERNWPFGIIEGDTVEPLLLPWRDREVRKRL